MWMILFNDAGRVFISDIKSIESEYGNLFKRMADVRIWSIFDGLSPFDG